MKLNHHIVTWITNALKLIALVFVCSVVIVLLMLVLSGCRTVKTTTEKENKTLDSSAYYQKDTSSKKQTIDFAEIFSAKNFRFIINFDTSKKLAPVPIIIKKEGRSFAITFLENLVSLSDQNIKSIDISASDLKDSTYVLINTDSSGSHVVKAVEKHETVKKTVENKSVKSNSNLLIISGILIFLLAIFFAVFTYFKKTTSLITTPLNAIKNFFK